jgi:hypothetical protein
MERYTITVPIPPGASSIRLLIPFPPTSSIAALAAEVKKRASRSALPLDALSDLILHLGDAAGPILDDEDLLEDVIIDPKNESITATPRNVSILTGLAPPLGSNDVSHSFDLDTALISTRLPYNKHGQVIRAHGRSRSA